MIQGNLVELPKIDMIDLTVSGLSSGAYMAVQYHIAHSDRVNGSAIFAGGPYYCAESTILLAETRCMHKFEAPETVNKLVEYTQDAAHMGTIADTTYLKNQRVFLWSGQFDSVVDPSVMEALYRYYNAFMPAAQISSKFDTPAEHCIPTLDWGEACAQFGSPFIGNCNYDGAGNALRFMLSGDASNLEMGEPVDNNLIMFDQTPFFSGLGEFTSIADVGYAYVPNVCQEANASSQPCHLHVSFHGCEQNTALIGDDYARHSGFNAWAEANAIVVLYPYIRQSNTVPFNPKGCWDWWGYTNDLYGLREGKQIEFITRLIDHVSGR